MRQIGTAAMAAMLALAGSVASGEIVRVKSAASVGDTMDALEAAVTGAGAAVVARIDHAGAAEKAGMKLSPEQLLIFGNPKLGTPAMQDNALAGLYLPLKVLVYRDGDGHVWLAYEDPGEMLGALDGIEPAAGYVKTMRGALGKLTAKAAGGS